MTPVDERGNRHVQAKLHPGVLCLIHPDSPSDHSEFAYWTLRGPIFVAYVNQ
jgi:cyclohexadienyl dehydratase